MGRNVGLSRDDIVCVIDLKSNFAANKSFIGDLKSKQLLVQHRSEKASTLIVTKGDDKCFIVKDELGTVEKRLRSNFYYDV